MKLQYEYEVSPVKQIGMFRGEIQMARTFNGDPETECWSLYSRPKNTVEWNCEGDFKSEADAKAAIPETNP